MHWIAQGRLDGLWFKKSDLTDSAELARLNNRVGEDQRNGLLGGVNRVMSKVQLFLWGSFG